MTERARYVFVVKEFEGGQPWICLESQDKQIGILKNGLLGFDLAEGISLSQAKAIAKNLNTTIKKISYTDLTA
ncbi:MAG TPA: hypothetical protein VK769_00995 [Verrucomicrobiae bacterium]|jgi:hypothetical protein|nr:hypothetical protein [Verrucomicrobiae bacterium]